MKSTPGHAGHTSQRLRPARSTENCLTPLHPGIRPCSRAPLHPNGHWIRPWTTHSQFHTLQRLVSVQPSVTSARKRKRNHAQGQSGVTTHSRRAPQHPQANAQAPPPLITQVPAQSSHSAPREQPASTSNHQPAATSLDYTAPGPATPAVVLPSQHSFTIPAPQPTTSATAPAPRTPAVSRPKQLNNQPSKRYNRQASKHPHDEDIDLSVKRHRPFLERGAKRACKAPSKQLQKKLRVELINAVTHFIKSL